MHYSDDNNLLQIKYYIIFPAFVVRCYSIYDEHRSSLTFSVPSAVSKSITKKTPADELQVPQRLILSLLVNILISLSGHVG